MPYFFTPPTIDITTVQPGTRALRWTYSTCSTVWRTSGVWQYAFTPASEDHANADLDGNEQLIYYTPVVVSDEIAAELIAAGIGTLNPIV